MEGKVSAKPGLYFSSHSVTETMSVLNDTICSDRLKQYTIMIHPLLTSHSTCLRDEVGHNNSTRISQLTAMVSLLSHSAQLPSKGTSTSL